MPSICRHCRHPKHRADCGVDDCGCIRFEPVDLEARSARQRPWIGQVSFLVRTGWTTKCEVRVRANGHSGAAMKAVREAKRLAVKSRAKIDQVKLTLIRVQTPVTASVAGKKPPTKTRAGSR